MAELRKTPLHPVYKEYGAKTVEFGGWDMPVQFSGILEEHESVRGRAGLFDVSHMGEFEVTGPDSVPFLQHMVTNDIARLEPGMATYSPLPNEQGGTVDDLLIYCFSETKFWVVVNAGNIDKDYDWFTRHIGSYKVEIADRSPEVALLAIQGPKSESILQKCTGLTLSELKYYRFTEATVAGVDAVVSRTGYTGEDGFELYVTADKACELWRALLAAGRPDGLVPCGLGARDTLRLEAKLPLYGHELSDDISPLEAGLGMFVKLDKGPFVGREYLANLKEQGVRRKIVGIRLLERGIPRAEYPVFKDGQEVGYVTSGTMSPTLKLPIGLALVRADLAVVGSRLDVEIRGKKLAAEVVKTPFYKRS